MKRSNEESLGDAIRRFLEENKLTGKLTQAEVVEAWQAVMGPAIDRRTQKLKLGQSGLLIVYLDSSVLRQELSSQRSRLADVLNEHIGRTVVKEIRFS